jgi:hypothetical protein
VDSLDAFMEDVTEKMELDKVRQELIQVHFAARCV